MLSLEKDEYLLLWNNPKSYRVRGSRCGQMVVVVQLVSNQTLEQAKQEHVLLLPV
jgi:hypothetical protein